jgi:NAD(P)H-dependent flavin oxidoreductase YrpB (nitropropane dioxygenase family)
MIGVVGLGTPLCQRLGIEHPVWCAGMGAAAGPDLVAAVSNAGGLGVLGAAGTVPEYVRRRAARVRELTDRPFGVNFIIDEDDPEDREYIRQEVAAAAASPPRACARHAERSSSAATSSSGPAAACARCQARRSGSAIGSVASASAACICCRSENDADRYAVRTGTRAPPVPVPRAQPGDCPRARPGTTSAHRHESDGHQRTRRRR